MAAKEKTLFLKVGSFANTECPICLESLKQPKGLPCLHTFCLQCLEQNGKDEIPGGKLACPLCRQEFVIPLGGFHKLPGNFFIEQLVEHLKVPRSGESKPIDAECGMCGDGNRKKTASVSKYCVECATNVCETCCETHKRVPALRAHKVVSIEEKEKFQTLMKCRPTYCDEHKDEQIKLYCYNCTRPICLMCKALNHSAHPCSDINKASQEFITKLQECYPQLQDCMSAVQNELDEQNENKEEILVEISAVEKSINDSYDQLLRVIESQRSDLLEKLIGYKTERLKAMQTRADECARQSVIMESFKKYIEELIEHGSACDISRSTNNLLARAEELVRAELDFNTSKLIK